MDRLIKLSTEKLLKKFGSGNHKPGSGSAAALQGLLAAQLIQTVIDLSKPKSGYRKWLSEFNRMHSEIENRVYPELLNLFQLDSEQFDKVILLRRERDDETNPSKKRDLIRALHEATLSATETPIAIAKLSVELAGFAIFICDHGFRTARGDSGVALNNTVATVSGCLSIINLNLLSLDYTEQIARIRIEVGQLRESYIELSAKADERLTLLEKEAQRDQAYHKELQAIASGKWMNSKLSDAEIENLARKVQNTLWKYRDKISKKAASENVTELLKPQVVLTKMLDYHYEELASLGQYFVEGEPFEIAGIIDKSERSVFVSLQFPKEIRNFTAAHELGHALLHQQTVQHRDKAIDGSGAGNRRDPIELQADKFAVYFLMPKKQVEGIFQQLFLTDRFVINQNTVFALTRGNITTFKRRCKTLRDLSRILASAEFYGDQPFRSIAKLFHVSVETMAIRLEELEMVEF